jgi:hypothetical protein
MIISIRGTHGSGKSTIMKALITQYATERFYGRAGKHRPEAYALAIPGVTSVVYVLGPYETACGGCDCIQPYALILDLLAEYSSRGHVLLEGALVSSSYGTVGHFMEKFGPRGIMAFLTTPLEECIKRIVQRRLDRGDLRPLNTKNTEGKNRSMLNTRKQIAKFGIIRAVDLDWQEPIAPLMALLKEGNDERFDKVDPGAGGHPSAAADESTTAMDDRSGPEQISFL